MATSGKTLVIRADAGPEIGVGHVMRCLGLAHAWQDAGGRVVYVMAPGATAVEGRLKEEGIDCVSLTAVPGTPADAAETAVAARRHAAAWVVIDGYEFDAEYQRAVREAGLKLLALDDYGQATHYSADVVLNQDLNAEEALYRSREPYTQLLLGPEYVLLRREFLRCARPEREAPAVASKLLVTLGGGDPDNVTRKAVDALVQLGDRAPEAIVVVGPSNPRHAELEAAAAASQIKIQVLRNVRNIPELMAWADMAMTAGGSTLWELALLRVPSLVLTLAANQAPSATLLAQRGGCRLLGDGQSASSGMLAEAIAGLMHDQPARAALARTIGAMVDGRGARRVCGALT